MADTLLAQTARVILAEALGAEVGIVVEVAAPGMVAPALRAKQTLYRFKNENSDFRNIQIRLSPENPDTELWLINSRED